ncbi:MAG: oligosaccharide flippase family protein [Reichenbachiella sp.]
MRHFLSNFHRKNDKGELFYYGALSFGIRVLGFIVSYLFVLLITRNYGTDVWGSFSLSLTLLQISSLILLLGVNVSVIKYYAGPLNRLGMYRRIFIFLIPFILCVSLLGALFSNEFSLFFKDGQKHYPFIKWMLIGILPYSLTRINAGIFRGLKNYLVSNFLETLGRFLIGGIIIAFLSLLFPSNPLLIVFGFVLGLIIVAIGSTLSLLPSLKYKDSNICPSNREILAISLPIMVSLLAKQALVWVNTIMGGFYLSSAELGIFDICYRISTFSSISLFAVNSIATTQIAKAYSNNDNNKLIRIIHRSNKLISIIGIPIIVGLIFCSDYILYYFDPGIKNYKMVLIIILGGEVFNCLTGVNSSFMLMTNLQKPFQNISALILVFNFLIGLIIIPIYGIYALAVMSLLANLLKNIICTLYTFKRTGILTFYFPFIKRDWLIKSSNNAT